MAKKGEVQIADRQVEALKLYEQGKTVQEIAETTGGALGTVQAWMRKFKQMGVTRGSHKEKGGVKVNWHRLEELRARTSVLPADDKDITLVLPPCSIETTDVRQQEPAKTTSRSKTVVNGEDFTAEEVAILKALAQRERARARAQRAGQGKVTSLRIDAGLLEALRKRAEEEGMTLGEALNQAIEVYLNL
jgi:DNA-binding CsgD family transcriptional regulator/uncharacterized protein (DUF4415 family)